MKRIAALMLTTLIANVLWAVDFSDLYGGIGPDNPSQIDPYAGLTSFPILLIPPGGKYEGMGTAFTAVATDSGYLEANPGAGAVLEFTELSFYHNNWISDSRLEGVVYTVRYDDLGIGIGGKFLYVPFTGYDDWGERESKGYYSETLGTFNVAYNFFSSYYFYGISLGTNLKVAYRNIPAGIYADQSAFSVMSDIGILTRLNALKFYSSRSKNLSIGAVVKNLGLPALDEPLPAEVTMGLAYSPLRPVTISFDATKPFSGDWSFAGGTDVVFTEFFSVQGGFRYRGSNPRISLGGAVDLDDVSFIVNYTLDMTTQFDRADRFSIQAKLNFGDNGRKAVRDRVDELYALGIEAFANGKYREAINLWEEALILDPGFQPAQKNIDTAEQALRLQEEMRKVQTGG